MQLGAGKELRIRSWMKEWKQPRMEFSIMYTNVVLFFIFISIADEGGWATSSGSVGLLCTISSQHPP